MQTPSLQELPAAASTIKKCLASYCRLTQFIHPSCCIPTSLLLQELRCRISKYKRLVVSVLNKPIYADGIWIHTPPSGAAPTNAKGPNLFFE